MTDPDELPAEEEERLAALLREAAGPASMPPEVAARLDAVLAELSAERAAAGAAEVTPLHRRRRRGRVLLGAAAAAAAGIIAIPTLLDQAPVTQSSSDAGAQAEDETSDGQAGGDSGVAAGDSGGDSEGPEDAPVPEWRVRPDREARLVPGLGPVQLDPDRLEADVLAALRAGQRLDVVPPVPAEGSAECPAPVLGPEQSWSPAVYDGRRAVLVASPEEAGTVAASVRDCSGTELVEVTVELR